VCDFIKYIENLSRYIFLSFIIANFDFCDVKSYRLSLLNCKSFYFNYESFDFLQILYYCKTFINTINISVFIKKISLFVLLFVDKY